MLHVLFNLIEVKNDMTCVVKMADVNLYGYIELIQALASKACKKNYHVCGTDLKICASGSSEGEPCGAFQ